MGDPPVRHVILVGLPGVGKTTVGRVAATRLGLAFVDLDEAIAQLDGRDIPTIFAESGEPVFRELERVVSVSLLEHQPAIIAAGGGWASNSDAVLALAPTAKRIYMKASPATAVRRMGVGTADRPLLAEGDPQGRVERLLEARGAAYETADAVVDTEHVDLQHVIDAVTSLAGGWLAGYVTPPFRRG